MSLIAHELLGPDRGSNLGLHIENCFKSFINSSYTIGTMIMGGRKVRIKALSILLLFVLATSFFALVQARPQTHRKGTSSIDFYKTYRGKPPKPGRPNKGIATGVVSDPPPASDRWAVIIGISDYKGDAYDLDYCDDDAWDFHDALVSKYGWSSSNIKMLIDGQATKASILGAIDWMRTKEDSGDEVVFFYSGHGSVSNRNADNDRERRDECIIPWEIEWDYFIWDGDLQEEFSSFESTRILFYFDSCYSGGMTDLAGDGRLICMACKESQSSWEMSAYENGQFTYYFVDQGMLAGEADANNDNVVTCEEAFDYAKANCQSQSPTASDNFEDDMLL